MSTVYYLKWGRLQLDMLEEYNPKKAHSTLDDDTDYRNETLENTLEDFEQKEEVVKKVNYIKIPLKRNDKKHFEDKSLVDSNPTFIEISEDVHNTLKTMSECFVQKQEEDIYESEALKAELEATREAEAEREISLELEEEEELEIEAEREISIDLEEQEELEAELEVNEEDEMHLEFEEEAEREENIEEDEVPEISLDFEEEGLESDEVPEISLDYEEEEELEEDLVADEETESKFYNWEDEGYESEELDAKDEFAAGIDSHEGDEKGPGNVYIGEEYNPINEEEILEKLSPKMKVVDEYDWHENSYYEQQKIDQLIEHYLVSEQKTKGNPYHPGTGDNYEGTNQGTNKKEDSGFKSKIKGLFTRSRW